MATLNHQNDVGNTRLKHDGSLTAKITPDMFPASAADGSGDDTAVVFAVPNGSVITSVRVVNVTAWNGTGTEVLVGTKSDDDAFVTAGNFSMTTGVKVGSGTGDYDTGDANLPIHVKLNWTNGANNKPTAGESYLVVQYVEYGKDAGSPSMAQVHQVHPDAL